MALSLARCSSDVETRPSKLLQTMQPISGQCWERMSKAGIEHFRRKVAECDPNEHGTAPAQVLVGLLSRLERYPEAISISLEHLKEVDPNQQACPSVLQLCQWAGDFEQLRKIASEQGDVLSFTAVCLQELRLRAPQDHETRCCAALRKFLDTHVLVPGFAGRPAMDLNKMTLFCSIESSGSV